MTCVTAFRRLTMMNRLTNSRPIASGMPPRGGVGAMASSGRAAAYASSTSMPLMTSDVAVFTYGASSLPRGESSPPPCAGASGWRRP